jgi:hypothetical protein
MLKSGTLYRTKIDLQMYPGLPWMYYSYTTRLPAKEYVLFIESLIWKDVWVYKFLYKDRIIYKYSHRDEWYEEEK